MKPAAVFIAALALVLGACTEQPKPDPSSPPPAGTPPPVTTPPGTPVTALEGAWSNPSTWGGKLPDASSSVTIPDGKTVTLDSNATVKNLTVKGKLVFADKDLELTTDWIMAEGKGVFQVGLELKRYVNKATITLTGAPSENIMGMGGKFLGAMMGGSLELHGEQRQKVWTRVSASLEPGATQMTLAEDVDWRSGEKIVLAASGFDPEEAEPLTVTARDGRTITFSPALKYKHLGVIENYDGKSLDMRAEVGLLTRNIVVQGDAASENMKFGGHTMVMVGSVAHVEGVEFYRMGQKGRLGRYPFHWHLAGNVAGQYAKQNSINHSYQRCLAVHQADGALVQENVAYDNVSHCFFVENGFEKGNILERNIAFLSRPTDASQTNRETDLRTEEYAKAAQFWIRNPNNILRGNVAAGAVHGAGFWIDPADDDRISLKASQQPIGEFTGNSAHSQSPTTLPLKFYPPLASGFGLLSIGWQPKTLQTLRDFTAYRNNAAGVWLEVNQKLEDFIVADNHMGFAPFNVDLENGVIVGHTQNGIGWVAPGGSAPYFVGIGHAFYQPMPPYNSNQNPSAPTLKNVSFVNFNPADPQYRGYVAVTQEFNLHSDQRANASGIKYFNSPSIFRSYEGIYGKYGSIAIQDMDGTLSGSGTPSTLVSNKGINVTSACVNITAPTDGNPPIARCPTQQLGYLSLDYHPNGRNMATVTRDDGASSLLVYGFDDPDGTAEHHVTTKHLYTVSLPTTPTSRYYISLAETTDWIDIAIPVPSSANPSNLTVVGSKRDPGSGNTSPDLSNKLSAAPSLTDAGYLAGTKYYFKTDSGKNFVYLRMDGSRAGADFVNPGNGHTTSAAQMGMVMWVCQTNDCK